MITKELMFTRGDYATQPGGIILRERKGQWIVHRFNRKAHTRTPTEYFWGHYFNGEDAETRARADFARVCREAGPFKIAEGVIIAEGDAGYNTSGNWEQN